MFKSNRNWDGAEIQIWQDNLIIISRDLEDNI